MLFINYNIKGEENLVLTFTVTAYNSALPELECEAGVATSVNAVSIPVGAYVIFTYNTTVVKSVVVDATGKAKVAEAATADDVVAFTGTAASNQTSNESVYGVAPVEEVAMEDAAMEDAE